LYRSSLDSGEGSHTFRRAVTFCFSRLLLAILRVRSLSRRAQVDASGSSPSISEYDLPYHQRYSLTFHPNFSNLSTNFVNTIGRSSRGPPRHVINSRNSIDSDPFQRSRDLREEFNSGRDFRSPTPGSSQGLLDRSMAATPASDLSQSTKRRTPHQEEEVAEVLEIAPSRRSSESIGGGSIASRASTYLAAGGFVGNSAVRQAIIREAWRDQDPPGTGHSPKVELSEKEARGAIIRLGGHLASSLLSYVRASDIVTFSTRADIEIVQN